MLDSFAQQKKFTGAAIFSAAFVLFIGLAFGLVARAEAQSSTRLTGQISNGTHGVAASSVANLGVTLFQVTAAGPVTRTAQTDANGRFAFDNVAADASTNFFARVDYAGLHYYSEIVPASLAASTPLTLTVYETATIPANFQLDGTHLVLDVGQGQLNGFEIVQVANSSDHAFLLPLPIPNNVSEIAFEDPRDQARAVRNDDGSISFPILPTTQQIVMGISVPTHAQQSDYTLALPLPIGVGQLNVLVSQLGDVTVSSSELKPGGIFTAPSDASKYWTLNGGPFPAGATIRATISNLPGVENTSLLRTMVLAAGGLGALALLVVPLARKRKNIPVANTLAASERLARLQAIAALDAAFAAGQMGEEEYHAQRAALKAELMQASTDANG